MSAGDAVNTGNDDTSFSVRPPSPARVRAGRANRLKRGPLSEEGRERLKSAIRRHQPWNASTGPKTAAGKARVALNGKSRQSGKYSIREKRALLAEPLALCKRVARLRNSLGGGPDVA